MIHELVEAGGKPLWDWQPPAKDEAMIAQVTGVRGGRAARGLSAALASRRGSSAQGRSTRRSPRSAFPPDAPPGYANEVNNFVFELEVEDRAQPDPVRRAAHRRPRHAHRAADQRSAPACCRARTAPRCSRAARRRRSSSRRSAPRATSRHRRADGRIPDRFMLHYNMPPYATGETGRVGTPKRREIGHGRLAKRALLAVLPTAEEFAYSMRVVSEITEIERQLVDGVGLRREPRADGRRRADEGARRRHRDGPHQGRQPLRRADRHPRRRGSPRRHGLQGRRHRPRHHGAADGHQDPGHHQGDHGGRAVAGARRPHAHPAADAGGAAARAHRGLAARAAHDDVQDQSGEDPRRDRQGRRA